MEKRSQVQTLRKSSNPVVRWVVFIVQVIHLTVGLAFVVVALVEFARDPPFFDTVDTHNSSHIKFDSFKVHIASPSLSSPYEPWHTIQLVERHRSGIRGAGIGIVSQEQFIASLVHLCILNIYYMSYVYIEHQKSNGYAHPAVVPRESLSSSVAPLITVISSLAHYSPGLFTAGILCCVGMEAWLGHMVFPHDSHHTLDCLRVFSGELFCTRAV